MSGLSRRAMLKGGAIASAAIAVPVSAAIRRGAGLVAFDSTIPESRAFARIAGTAQRLDLATEHRTRFAGLRGGLPKRGSIEGLTRWSDWVALRGELESQGWRVSAEARTGHRGELFRWTMRRV